MIEFLDKDETQIDDISGLKISWIKTKSQLNNAEAENILKAYNKYFSRKGFNFNIFFSIKFIKQIHLDMFKNVWSWAGQFRRTKTNLGVIPYQIPIELAKGLGDIQYLQDKLSILELSAILHHKLVQIHPFTNGNGRHARFVSDLFLHNFKGRPTHWPLDLEVDCPNRKEYIIAIKEADMQNYDLLLKFMLKHKAQNPSIEEILKNQILKKYYKINEIRSFAENIKSFNKTYS